MKAHSRVLPAVLSASILLSACAESRTDPPPVAASAAASTVGSANLEPASVTEDDRVVTAGDVAVGVVAGVGLVIGGILYVLSGMTWG